MRTVIVRFASTLAAGFIVLASPGVAGTSCATGTLPSSDDVRYVSVSQFELPNVNHASYHYEAQLYDARSGRPAVPIVRLHGSENVPKIGDFTAARPSALFRDVVAVLQTRSFFGMRLNPASVPYIDGPEDSITVGACGMQWTLSTIAKSQQFDLRDENARRFFAHEDALRAAIFSAEWIPASSDR